MANKTKNLVFYFVLAYLVVASLFMAYRNDKLNIENERLHQENATLEQEIIELELDLYNLTDANWQLNNQLMKEGDQLE